MKKASTFVLALLVLVSVGCSTAQPAVTATVAPTAAAQSTSQPAKATTAAPTAAPAKATATSGSSKSSTNADISSALNLVIGAKDKPSVFASYHLVSKLVTPQLSDDKTSVATKTTQVTVDVQGENVHLFMTADKDPQKEGYIMGEQEYRMTNGKPEEMMGQISLSWAFWQLGATIPFATGAALSSKGSNEAIDGRQADVYIVDTAKADPAILQGFRSLGMFPLNSMKGTIWIDQQTGGVLKAVLDYEMDIVNTDSNKSVGTGQGHLDLEVTQVGKISVKMP